MEQKDQEIREKLKAKINFHSNLSLKVLFVFLWIATIIMLAAIVVGLYKVSFGIFIEIKNIYHFQNEGILEILHGLEIIFLSPLIYFLILAFTKYFSVIKADINVNINDLRNKQEYLKHAIHEINSVKALTIGLFLSLLFLHSLSILIKNEQVFDKFVIIFTIGILLALILYYFVLDKVSEKLRKNEQAPK